MRKLAKTLDLSLLVNKRFIIIGDLHGCYDQLIELLQKCNYNKNIDIVVSCGDLCDRGYNNVDVLKFFIESPNTYCVLGNHDDKLKRYLLGNKVKIGRKLQSTIEEISVKCDLVYKQKISNYLNDLPHLIRLPDFDNKPCFVVHAGIDAKYSIDKQTPETCIYIRGIDPKNYFDESKGIWYDFLDGSYTVLSGHIVSSVIQPNSNVFCLDGGCCHSGKLRSLIIKENKWEIIEVEGHKRNMKIPEQFKTSTNEELETLISPEFGVGNEAWKDFNLRWLRSMHIDRNDHVISVGFPKFMNIGEGCNQFNISEKDLLDNKKDLIATLKIDGSLLIRYVHNGIVKWRTRGSLEVGLDNKDEINDFIKKYPKLNNPSLYNNVSLLFEWVSPKNQIVIKYESPDIFLVGAILYEANTCWYNNSFSLIKIKENDSRAISLEKISADLDVRCVPHFNLTNQKEIIDLISKLKTEKEIEGYVIRLHQEQALVKIKSDHYFILHTLKSKLTTESLIDLWLSWGKPDYETFHSKFEAAYDFETWTTIIPAISSIYDGIKVADAIINHIIKFVEENRHLQRKDFALMAKQKYQNEKLSMCFSLLDNKPLKNNPIKTFIMQNCKMYELSLFKKNIPQDELEES